MIDKSFVDRMAASWLTVIDLILLTREALRQEIGAARRSR
jgi:hypothetical protein